MKTEQQRHGKWFCEDLFRELHAFKVRKFKKTLTFNIFPKNRSKILLIFLPLTLGRDKNKVISIYIFWSFNSTANLNNLADC